MFWKVKNNVEYFFKSFKKMMQKRLRMVSRLSSERKEIERPALSQT